MLPDFPTTTDVLLRESATVVLRLKTLADELHGDVRRTHQVIADTLTLVRQVARTTARLVPAERP